MSARDTRRSEAPGPEGPGHEGPGREPSKDGDPGPGARSVDVTVDEVRAVTPEVLDALARLVPQLSSSAPAVEEQDVRDIAQSPATMLLVARDAGGALVGSLTLVVFKAPTGPRAWIEDVVVERDVRGGGIGSTLVREALVRARAAGARTVDLTSRPSREEANRLYLRLGFAQRATNVYRYDLQG
jgi:ribosomal protein S18 acetylase RimI-like enzyme